MRNINQRAKDSIKMIPVIIVVMLILHLLGLVDLSPLWK